MKVYIGCGGATRGRALANILAEFIAGTIARSECWVSHDNAAKGRQWSEQFVASLDEVAFGVMCVTPESQGSWWLLWEAGCLDSRAATLKCRVAVVVLAMAKEDLSGPWAFHQALDTTRAELVQLIGDINASLPEPDRASPATLAERTALMWPQLSRRIDAALALAP